MQHASRNTQAASILLFFLLSFFYLRPSPRETRVFRSFKFSYSKPLSLSLSLSVWQEKSRENLPRFDKFFSHKKPQFSTSNFNSSNLILEINIYLVFISIKKIRNSRNVRRGGKEMSDAFFPSPRRSATQPFLSSLPPSFCPFLAPL